MYEVELKVRADLQGVTSRLESLAAESLGTVRQVDTYYDAPHRDFAQTDEALRLRRETRFDDTATETKLTYKGPLVETESKTREEFETGVDDGETTADIVEALGFEPAAVVRKERERYAVDGFTVTLDSVAEVGTFVEVETTVETEDDVAAARDEALELLERLGLDPEERTQASYLGLLLADE